MGHFGSKNGASSELRIRFKNFLEIFKILLIEIG